MTHPHNPGRGRNSGLVAAILAGLVAMALLGWVLWTLSTDGALETSADLPVVRPPESSFERATIDLPVASDTSSGQITEARPRDMQAAEPAPQGPDGVRGLVLDGATGEPVPVFQVHAGKVAQGLPFTAAVADFPVDGQCLLVIVDGLGVLAEV